MILVTQACPTDTVLFIYEGRSHREPIRSYGHNIMSLSKKTNNGSEMDQYLTVRVGSGAVEKLIVAVVQRSARY